MRCTQVFGLNEKAVQFIEENCRKIPLITCPCCGYVVKEQNDSEEYEDRSDLGMFGDGPMLREYKLKDGRVVKEVVQTVFWSSGPNIYLCLEDEQGNMMFEWDV